MAAPMTRDEVDQALATLGPTYDRIAAAMFRLDQHPGLTHLRGAGLTGTSGTVAAEVQELMTMLWAQFTLLRQKLELARDTRAARSRLGSQELVRFTRLLRDPVVPLREDGMPSDGPDTAVGQRLTLAELAGGLERSTAQLGELLDEVDTAVSTVVGRLSALTDSLGEVRALADAAGDDGVDRLEADLQRAHACALADPLDVAGGAATAVEEQLRRLAEDLHAVRTRLAELAGVREDFPQRMAGLRAAAADLTAAEAEAAAVYATVYAKIANPGLPTLPGAASQVKGALSPLERLHQERRWAELVDQLAALERRCAEARDYAYRLRDAAGGLLDRRTELRGRLGAYRAKASRLGHGEHPELSARHREAYDLLYTSPCDLPAATRAVFDYQETLAQIAGESTRAPKETPA